MDLAGAIQSSRLMHQINLIVWGQDCSLSSNSVLENQDVHTYAYIVTIATDADRLTMPECSNLT